MDTKGLIIPSLQQITNLLSRKLCPTLTIKEFFFKILFLTYEGKLGITRQYLEAASFT